MSRKWLDIPFFSVRLVIFVVLVKELNSQSEEQAVHPGAKDIVSFKDRLDTILDAGAGVNLLAAALKEKMVVSTPNVDAENITAETANWVKARLDLSQEAVMNLRKVLINLRSSGGFAGKNTNKYFIRNMLLNFQECCDLDKTELEFSPRYRTYVDFTRYCFITGYDVRENPLYLMHQRLLYTFQNNRNLVKDIGYQFVGTHEGITVVYPAAIPHTCYGRDYYSLFKLDFSSKERPWYGSAFNKILKDVVIVIDNSMLMPEVMYNSELSVHQAVIKMVNITVQTLTPADRFAIVVSPPMTTLIKNQDFTRELVHPTESAKHHFYSYLPIITATGASDYSAHFEKAVKVIKNSKSVYGTAKRRTIIMVLTGVMDAVGGEDREALLQKTNDHLRTINSSAHLFLLGVGKLSPIIANTLRMLSVYSEQPAPGGIFYYLGIRDPVDEVEAKLTKFLQRLHDSYVAKAEVSLPYKEALSLDMVTSVSVVLDTGKANFGVAGLELLLDEFQTEYMGQKSIQEPYAFLCDLAACNVFNHPLFPTPNLGSDQITQAAVALPLSRLDRGKNIPELVSAVTQGMSMKIVTQSVLPLTTGMPRREPVSYVRMNCTFTVTAVPEYKLAVIFVQPMEYPVINVSVSDELSEEFIYHENVHMESDLSMCKMFLLEAHIEKSVVKFAPKSFKDQSGYIHDKPTHANISQTKLITDLTPLLKYNAINDVKLSGLVDESWAAGKDMQLSKAQFVIVRYVGTNSGVFRFQPGLNFEQKDYDPTITDWYMRASRFPRELSVGSPRLDIYNNGFAIPLSKAILYPNSSLVWGVVGIDISIPYFETLLMDVQYCKSDVYQCLVADSAGYIIYHKSWTHSDRPEIPKVQAVHIMELEGTLGNKMLTNRHMVKLRCLQIGEDRVQNSYKISVQSVDLLQSELGYYKIDALHGTNIYVIVLNVVDQIFGPAACLCRKQQLALEESKALEHGRTLSIFDEDPTNIPVCPEYYSTRCHCPCLSPINWWSGLRTFDSADMKELPVCESPPLRLRHTNINYDGKKYYSESKLNEMCLQYDCEKQTTFSECNMISLCHWCEFDYYWELPLEKPFCGQFDTCFFGQVGSEPLLTARPTESKILEMIAVPVVSVASFIIIAVSIFCSVRSYRRAVQKRQEEEEKKEEAISEYKKQKTAILAARKDEYNRVYLKNFITRQGGDYSDFPEDIIQALISGTMTYKEAIKKNKKRKKKEKLGTGSKDTITNEEKMAAESDKSLELHPQGGFEEANYFASPRFADITWTDQAADAATEVPTTDNVAEDASEQPKSSDQSVVQPEPSEQPEGDQPESSIQPEDAPPQSSEPPEDAQDETSAQAEDEHEESQVTENESGIMEPEATDEAVDESNA